MSCVPSSTRYSCLICVEVVAQNLVYEIRLRDFMFVSRSLDEFLVVVPDDDRLVFCWVCPRAYLADQIAPSASGTLAVVALLAEWLKVFQVVRAVSGARNLMDRAQLYVRLLAAAGRALISVLLLEFFPVGTAKLRSRLAFLACFQALQLVAVTLLSDRGETFFPLQFPQPTEDVLIRRLAARGAECVHGGADLRLRQHRAGNAVPYGPKRLQDNAVVNLVRRGRINKQAAASASQVSLRASDSLGAALGVTSRPLLARDLAILEGGSRCDSPLFSLE